MSGAELKFLLRQIEASDRLNGFALGHSEFTPLKIFLLRHSKTYHIEDLAKTYGLFDRSTEKISAYITLLCGEIAVDDGGKLLQAALPYQYRSYPAIKIARLAVHSETRGLGLGSHLISFALGIAKNIVCPAIGCRFIIVDAKKSSIGFYLSCGFTILDTESNKKRSEPVMFIDLHKVT